MGVKFIYIFALPYEGLITRYSQYGFKRFEPDQEADVRRRKRKPPAVWSGVMAA